MGSLQSSAGGLLARPTDSVPAEHVQARSNLASASSITVAPFRPARSRSPRPFPRPGLHVGDATLARPDVKNLVGRHLANGTAAAAKLVAFVIIRGVHFRTPWTARRCAVGTSRARR